MLRFRVVPIAYVAVFDLVLLLHFKDVGLSATVVCI
jgi:hypothetical protein